MQRLVDVSAVEVVGDHRLRVTLEDGVIGDVSFTNTETWRGLLAELKDPRFFAQVRVDPECGTIVWPNGVDCAPEPLYEEARRNRVAPAGRARSG